jgi:hypothetical protein
MSTTMTLSVPRLTGYARVQHVEVSLPRIDQLLEPPSRYGVAEPAARCWTPDRVKERLVEAFEIERRIPGGRVGPAVIRSSWPTNTRDSFSDRVHQGKTVREEVWRAWARAGGATPQEVTRMEQALAWPGSILANGRAFEGRHGRAFIVTRPMAPRASPRRSDSVACRWAEAAKVRGRHRSRQRGVAGGNQT